MSTPTPAPPLHNSLAEALGHAPSDKRLEVLRRVGETGSISQAARDAGISYKAAWQAIDTMSNLSGQTLVERTVGGSGGGGASITPQGLQLLAVAAELARARQQVLARFTGGEGLAAGLGLRTSMRNQLPCRVVAVEPLAPQDPAVQVRMQTAGGDGLTSSITQESADLLDLRPGLEVLVLCKATAVAVVSLSRAAGAKPIAGAPDPACALLSGKVERVTLGQGRDEVVLALAGGGHWVGFAAHPSALRRGQAARAQMPSSSLVVALPG